MQKKGPSFLIIGAMKSGTTSLHNYLGCHPCIFTTRAKEIHFFADGFYDENRFERYLDHFRTDKRIAGASPQNYTKRHFPKFQGAPKRIHTFFPDIKLIYLVRDPVARIYSHHYELQALGHVQEHDINHALRDFSRNDCVLTSMYHFQLEPYLELFPKESILVVESEKLKCERLATLNSVFSFLGMHSLADDEVFQVESNTSEGKRKKSAFGRAIEAAARSPVGSIAPKRLKRAVKDSFLLNRLGTQEIRPSLLDSGLEREIREFLRPDTEKLRQVTGQGFSTWSL